MTLYERELTNYQILNQRVSANGVVILGSSFAKEIPVNELKQSVGIDSDIYNRSITDLSVFDGKYVLEDCVYDLNPKRVLLNLGETDLECGFRTIDEIVEAYRTLIDDIKVTSKHCEVIVVSVCSNRENIHPEELNKRLQALAKEKKCRYADITAAFATEAPRIKAFDLLKSFLRDRMSITDIMLAV